MTMRTKLSSAAAPAIATALAAALGILGGGAIASASGTLTVSATSGGTQQATLGTAFGSRLVATVSGVTAASCPSTVSFSAPASGPSAKFSATGTADDNVGPASTTPAGGDCTYESSGLSANDTAGTYDVEASVSGGSGPATFSLTNDGISASSGTPQTTQVGTAFPTALQVAVFRNGAPVAGATVTFTAPSSGPSGVFSSTNTRSATAVTGSGGLATAPSFTANDSAGSYTLTASTSSVAGSASFSLTNSGAGVAYSVTERSGSPQSAQVGTTYGSPLVARVTDVNGNPVQGAMVTFSIGSGGAGGNGGASGSFVGGGGNATVTTDSAGDATSPEVQANGVAGTFTVTAGTQGVTEVAQFTLTNDAAAPSSVSPGAGVTQRTPVGSTFPIPLSVTVTDADRNPVPGVTVTFSAPSSGPSGTFADGGSVAGVVTNASGIAVAPAFRANGLAGGYIVTASVRGVSPSVAFALVNEAGPATRPSPRPGAAESYAGMARTADGHGYWLAGRDGGVFTFGDAAYHGSVPGLGKRVSDVAGIAATADGGGYWLAGRDGGIFSFGDARYFGSLPARGIRVSDIVGMGPAAGGDGYWLAGSDGGVFSFGDAAYRGSLPARGIHVSDVVGIVPTPSDAGYWLVGSDGGVFSFGDATFAGSGAG
jgi:hypothetical protein